MKNPLWFRAKLYGYGWYPSTWQGWLVILIWLILLVSWITFFEVYSSIEENIWSYLTGIFILTGTLVFISWLKGEEAHWRWGLQSEK